jgi:branched-chain amino acid transport system ATP-binding protein
VSLLVVDDVYRHFGGVRAVDGVSFKVDEGQIKAMIGPNGAGKTTMFNLLTGLLRPDAGVVTFKGQQLTGLPPHRIAALGVARTFQSSQVFGHMTVLENAMVGCHRWTRAGISDALLRTPAHRLEESDISEWASHALSVAGIEALAGLPAAALTHGQRRLLELARALAARPDLMLLDEPAAGLSGAETDELEQALYRIRDAGATILLVEHDMGLVMGCSDEVLVLAGGCKIAEGPPLLVRSDPEVIAAYLGEPEVAGRSGCSAGGPDA